MSCRYCGSTVDVVRYIQAATGWAEYRCGQHHNVPGDYRGKRGGDPT